MLKFAIFSSIFFMPLAVVVAAPFKIENVEVNAQHWQGDQVLLDGYNDSRPPTILLETPKSLQSCKIDGQHCQAVRMELTIKGDAKVVHQLDLGSKKFKIQMQPEDFPYYEITGHSALDKDVLLAPANAGSLDAGFVLVIGPSGELRFFRRSKQVLGDFRPHQMGPKKLFSYLEVTKVHKDITMEGHRVLLDADKKILKKFESISDFHDFVLKADQTRLEFSYQKIRSDFGLCVFDSVLREVAGNKTRDLISTLDLYKQGLFYRSSYLATIDGESCLHLFHLNNIQPIDSTHAVLNYGNEFAGLFDFKKRTFDWMLGGINDQFGLPAETKATLTHTPWWDLKTSTLYQFENGVAPGGTTRITSFKLDTKHKKLITYSVKHVFKENSQYMGGMEVHADNWFSAGMGFKLNGLYDFVEVKDGHEIFSIKFKSPLVMSYKAYRN